MAKEIGALAKPDDIRFTDTLPKTRSGKIMRRLLRELATSGDVKGDTTTLEDFGVIAKTERAGRSLAGCGKTPDRLSVEERPFQGRVKHMESTRALAPVVVFDASSHFSAAC